MESNITNVIAGVISDYLEFAAVIVITFAVLFTIINFIIRFLKRDSDAFKKWRRGFGKSLQAGLELLIAADIIGTIATEMTLESILILGLLVIVRTFLSWSVEVEMEGRWPWQRNTNPKTN